MSGQGRRSVPTRKEERDDHGLRHNCVLFFYFINNELIDSPKIISLLNYLNRGPDLVRVSVNGS